MTVVLTDVNNEKTVKQKLSFWHEWGLNYICIELREKVSHMQSHALT